MTNLLQRHGTLSAPLTLVLVIIFFAPGCAISDAFRTRTGDDPPPQPTATSEPVEAAVRADRSNLRHRIIFNPPVDYDGRQVPDSPEDTLIAMTSDRWSATDSIVFELEVDGTTYLDVDETIELDAVEGVLARPNLAEAEATVKIGFATFDVGLVVVGNEVYMTNFLTGSWERGPSNFDFNPALIFDDNDGIGAVLEKLQDVEVGEASTVGTVDVVEISGTISRSDINQLVAGSLEGDEMGVSLWVDKDTGDLLEIRIAESESGARDPTAWEISFTDHNQPVSISAPDI